MAIEKELSDFEKKKIEDFWEGLPNQFWHYTEKWEMLTYLFPVYVTIKGFNGDKFLSDLGEENIVLEQLYKFIIENIRKGRLNEDSIKELKPIRDKYLEIDERIEKDICDLSPKLRKWKKREEWICKHCGKRNYYFQFRITVNPENKGRCWSCGKRPLDK